MRCGVSVLSRPLWGLPSPVWWALCPALPPPPGLRASFLAQGPVAGPTSRTLAAGAPCRAPFRFWSNLCLALTQWGFCPSRPSGCHFVPPHCASSLFQQVGPRARGLSRWRKDTTPRQLPQPSLGQDRSTGILLVLHDPSPLAVTSAEGEREQSVKGVLVAELPPAVGHGCRGTGAGGGAEAPNIQTYPFASCKDLRAQSLKDKQAQENRGGLDAAFLVKCLLSMCGGFGSSSAL